jgi:hypothetical protein
MLRIALVLIVLVSPAFAAPDANQLAKDKVTAAEQVYQGTLAGLKTGRAVAESVYTWSVRWLDAELATGKAAKQAFADHLARMTSLEADLAKSVQTGQAAPTEHAAATYFKLEAELWTVRNRR